MERFGQNPFAENIWRIVFCPSRRHIVYGEWLNGERKASWCTTYPDVGPRWILEKWISAFEFARCNEDQWNQELTVLGPYPSRGEYHICHTFSGSPADANVEKLIVMILQGKKHSYQEVHTACVDAYEKEQAEISNEMQARIGNVLPAFGAAPLSGYGGGRGTKTFEVNFSAAEAGLPIMPRAGRNGQTSRSTLVSIP